MENKFSIRPTIRNSDFIEMLDAWDIPYTGYLEELQFENAKCKFRAYDDSSFKCTGIRCDTVNDDVLKIYAFNTNENIGGVMRIPFRDVRSIQVEKHGHEIIIMTRDYDEPWAVLFL